MDKFYKRVKISSTVSTGIVLSGNINEVSMTLKTLSYIFKDRRINEINLQQFAEAEGLQLRR